MFNFVCKTLLLHYGRRCCTITGTSRSYCNKEFAFPIFIKCISTTTTTSNQHSFTVSYLMNSCGLSLQSALLASKRVHFDSPENADSVIDLFKSHGFSETQITKAIRGNPRLLSASPEKTLLPKLEFFYSKGFSRPELARISSLNPNILCRSLENYIIPTFIHLIDLFESSETVAAAVKYNSYFLNLDVETYVAPSINLLRDTGVPERNIFLFVKMRNLFRNPDMAAFENNVEVVKKMGINPLDSKFILAVIAKGYGRINWESKVEIYRRLGWYEEDFLAAFRKNPLFMTASKDKIMAVMEFLVNKMGMESSAIVKRPDVIVLSLEKRLIPRAAVFQFLLSKGLIKRENTNLITFFTLPEEAFFGKFVNSYYEAPEILKVYQEQLGVSKMRKRSISWKSDAVIVK